MSLESSGVELAAGRGAEAVTERSAHDLAVIPAAIGGEMAELMRSWPWADTPFGPPERWPEMLRSSLSICLGTRFPIAIYWGPGLALVYNDAWRPILGTKHPWGLGRGAREVWPEIWDAIGPLFAQVVATGVGTYSEDQLLLMRRHGFTEECYFNFTFSPILGGDGRVGGIFNAVIETTERVVGERRLRTLRALGEQAAPGGTVDEACRAAAATLAENPFDVPFALLYLAGAEGAPPALVASSGVPEGAPFAPAGVGPAGALGAALAGAAASGEVVVDVPAERFGELPGGAWPEPPRQLVVLPLARAGQSRRDGFLVAGANPRRPLDEGYRGFLRLVAGHIASAVAGARAFEEERRRAEALAELDRAKTAFFSNVSHEFRTPLTLMLAPIEDLRASAAGAEERERVELLHRNARRLLRLVNNLLDFSRLEAGRLDASYEPTDLAALTADLASTFRSAIERAGLALVVECDVGGAPVYVDRGMWEKIVLNLLSNAFKFTFAGSIAVRLRAEGDDVCLEVADTGVGIPAGDLPRLFERFHRVAGARSRSHEGSGIGLALVHEFARLHGGDVRVESREGEGTTFRVRIPRGGARAIAERAGGGARATAEGAGGGRARAEGGAPSRAFADEASRWDAPGDESREPAGESRPGEARARIAVVDDNADLRDYLGRLLREQWDVDVYRDGRAALEAIRNHPPDLVVTDVMMPGLDGFGLLKSLRGDAHLRGLPVLMLSARAGEEAVAEAIAAGADDYLVKPFSARELLVRVAARLAATAAGKALREQRTDLYRAFMQAPFPVAIFRGEAHVIEAANDAVLRAWRKGPGVVGLPVLEALPELRGQEFPRLLDEAFRSGVAYEGGEERARLARGPDGPLEDAYFNYVYAPFRDASGDVAGLIVTAFEVTDQVKSREALQVTSRRLEAAQSVGGIGIFDWEIATGYIYWSPELYKLLGLEPDSVAPSADEWTARLHEPDREVGWGGFRAAAAAGRRRFDLELRLAQPDGSTRWVRLSSSLEYDAAGAPSRVLGAVVDIEALKQAATAREAERRRLFAMLQQVPASVNFLRGPELVFEFAHPKAVEASGRPLLGRAMLEAYPEYRGQEGPERLRRTLATGEPDVLHETEIRMVQDGREVVSYWDSVYVPMRDESGRVEGVMTFDLDVTRAVLARRELEAVNRAKDEFLATVSHELRTPLNAILGWAELLRKDPAVDRAKIERGLAVIERNAHTQARLVSDLLDVSRIISGKLRLTLRKTDPAAAIVAAADVVRTAADAKGVRLVLDLDPGLGAVVADPDRLQQVVWNLLANAVRFTPAKGQVTVKGEREGAELRIQVLDTGAGIAREHLPHIFERFRQVDSSTTRAHGGLGLGLAIVRHLVEAHGGTVSATSEGPGKGAAFAVSLPILSVDVSQAPAGAAAGSGDGAWAADALDPLSPSATRAALRGVRALVVDDDLDSLDLLRVVLEGAGAAVTTANGARGALAAAGPFDILISDIGMPEANGYALLERIRAGGRAANVPAIALTAYARREDAERALRAGFQEHVAKPVEAAKLVETVFRWARRPRPGA